MTWIAWCLMLGGEGLGSWLCMVIIILDMMEYVRTLGLEKGNVAWHRPFYVIWLINLCSYFQFGGDGVSPTEIVQIRLDGGANSVKCLINNSKWGMNPVLEEEEETSATIMSGGIEKEGTRGGNSSSGDYSSTSSNQRNSSPASPIQSKSQRILVLFPP